MCGPKRVEGLSKTIVPFKVTTLIVNLEFSVASVHFVLNLNCLLKKANIKKERQYLGAKGFYHEYWLLLIIACTYFYDTHKMTPKMGSRQVTV